MVRSFEAAGVAGIFFSDQVFPNRCGYLPGKEIVTAEQMLARVYTALDARRDESLMIVARTDAFGVEGLDSAVQRCRLFMEAGADAALAQGVDELAAIGTVVTEVPSPFLAIVSQAAGRPKASLAELDAAGASVVILPSISLFAAAAAVSRVLKTVRSAGLADEVFDDLIGLEEYYGVVGLADTLAREEAADVRARDLLRTRAGGLA
jgi:methylisocitrate lyase